MVAHSDLEGMFSLGLVAKAALLVPAFQLAQEKKQCFQYWFIYLFSYDCSHIGITRFSFWYWWKIWIKQLCSWVLLLVLWQRWVTAVHSDILCKICLCSVYGVSSVSKDGDNAAIETGLYHTSANWCFQFLLLVQHWWCLIKNVSAVAQTLTGPVTFFLGG